MTGFYMKWNTVLKWLKYLWLNSIKGCLTFQCLVLTKKVTHTQPPANILKVGLSHSKNICVIA